MKAAAQWAWVAVVYHAAFFTRINPAAWVFGAMFIAQAVMRLVDPQTVSDGRAPRRRFVAVTLMLYALAYPGLSVLSHDWPAVPLFLVPCPLVIFDTGLLLATRRPIPRRLLVVPILWAGIGGSAAVLFGVLPDMMLFACAALLIAEARR